MDNKGKKQNSPSLPNPNEGNDSDLMRFGHTVTLVSKTHAILFGGAKGTSGNYSILDDTYSFKINEKVWIKLNPSGAIPKARAAHGAASSENNKLVVFGGAVGGGGLAPDDLHLLDLTAGDDNCKWVTVPVVGQRPGGRYGHVMVYSKPYYIVFGGNSTKINNDVWIVNIDDDRAEWKKVEATSGESPCPRMYHSAAVCKYGSASGMIITFGGRSDTGNALNDVWGLRKHRNSTWDWVKAPFSNYTPYKRFQHTMAFYHNLLIILGGRTDTDIKTIPIEVYDTGCSEWFKLASFDKFRHSSWILDNFLYTHGGFDYSSPMISNNSLVMIDIIKLIETNPTLTKGMSAIIENVKKLEKEQQEKEKNSNKTTPNLSPNNSTITIKRPEPQIKEASLSNLSSTLMNSHLNGKKSSNNNVKIYSNISLGNAELSTLTPDKRSEKNQFVVINKVTIDEKGKYKITKDNEHDPLCDMFIKAFLNPTEWKKKKDNESERFKFKPDQIFSLSKQAIEVVKNQPIVVKINTPAKVFGDVHGQFQDLMRFFEMWGEPKEGPNGDISAIDYLFLGDYVDRGTYSLETICLLMALKVKYPERIHLLRGNHEDRLINANFGFLEECQNRLNEDPMNDDSIFNVVNEFFEYLPLAAIIEDQILCLHGGIGASLNYISDIEVIERPLEIVHEAQTKSQQIVMDILWSDPTDNDDELGIQPNLQRDSNNYGNIVKFGPDIVKKFLQQNNLNMIMRAHECVLDGFERFAGGSLITIFSATDYCRRHNNAGAMLIVKNNFEIIPHLIYPPDGGNKNWIDDDDYYKKRPPTPPRIRNNKGNY